jgi:hypothetical protein
VLGTPAQGFDVTDLKRHVQWLSSHTEQFKRFLSINHSILTQ